MRNLAFWRRERGTPVTIVSGLPRSGTSMMMQMLAAGGLPVLADDQRPPDENNPRGYYEYAPVRRLPQGDTAWVAQAQGRAVKVVSALLPQLPPGYPYRVILMQRALPEVLRSQAAMRVRLGAGETPDEDLLLTEYAQHLFRLRLWLKRQGWPLHEVDYAAALGDPAAATAALIAFLGEALDAQAMAAVMDPALYHQRAQGEEMP